MDDFMYLLCAFAGGIFGAAFGGITAFFLCGISVIAGSVIIIITGDYSFSNIITWGPFLGPHIVFSGAVAATAYAGKKGIINSGRNVLIPLFGLKDSLTLIIGGISGLSGYFLNRILTLLPSIHDLPFTDTISLTVVLNGFLFHFIFYRTQWVRKTSASGPVESVVGSWNPWSLPFGQLMLMAGSLSILSSWISICLNHAEMIVFGFCAISLILLQFGAKIPVVHHVALCSGLIAGKTGNILMGIGAGLLTALIAEIFARYVLEKSDSHIDPPAFSVAVITTLYTIIS